MVRGISNCGVTEILPRTVTVGNSALLSGITTRHSGKGPSSTGPHFLALPGSYSESTSVLQILNPLSYNVVGPFAKFLSFEKLPQIFFSNYRT